MTGRPFTIGPSKIGAGAPAFIIAELALAHDGSVGKGIRIAGEAARAGADGFSVHVTSLADYIVPQYGDPDALSAGRTSSKVFEYLQTLTLGFADSERLVERVRAAGLAAIVMPNDIPSLHFCKTHLHPDAYVLSPACFVEEDFVRQLGATGRPTIMRIGGATLGEIERSLAWLREAGGSDVLLLHGLQTYPTPLEQTHLRAIRTYSEIFGIPVGLADHLDGGDELAVALPPIALACGAVAFEKHITWDRSERGEDFESALDPGQFARFVQTVRAAERALGSASVPPYTAEVAKYRRVARKRVVAARDLAAGVTLAPSDLTCKRAEAGAMADQLQWFTGRRTRVALDKDAPLTVDVVE